ncbi:hypothetical protein LDENG_00111270 [Lucifuga dentata]|nr:hypothetical protein LDENG_00111270 [Lucifuga dentata]
MESKTMRRLRKKRSSVWEHFQHIGNFVRCNKCKIKLKYCDGATSGMIYHINGPCQSTTPRDDEETLPLKEESSAASDTVTFNNSIATSNHGSSDHVEKKRQKRSTVWDIFVRENDEVRCTKCDLKLKYKSSTTTMMYHIKNKHLEIIYQDGGVIPTEVTGLISRMITKDMLPIDVVDGEGFRELLGFILRSYRVPSSGEITRVIECHFEEKVEDLKAQLCRAEKVALTADCWTGHPFERYITISCSFITEHWQGRSAVLQTHRLSADHTNAENFAEKILDTVETWDLVGKVTACVHNCIHDILPDCACPHITWDSAVCFARTLQLAVNEGLSDDLLCIIVAAGKLVKYFNHSLQANEALALKQTQMCLPQNQLIQSSKARWNTICDMFERLLEQRWAIKAVLSDHTVTNRQEAQALELEDDHWQIIVNFTPVLATLKWVTTVVSAETEVSISNIYPIAFSLIQSHLVPKESDIKQVSEFKSKVQQSLRNQMQVDSNDLASKSALIASILDPRHKHLNFLTPTGRLAAKVKLYELVSKFDAVNTPVTTKIEDQETLVTHDTSQEAMISQIRDDTKNTMMLLLGDNYSSSYSTDSMAQVDYYLRDVSPPLNVDPLDWWRINGPRFPRVATLARHHLCIPGVTLPSLLSEEGQTFARARSRLTPEHADMMIFLNRNAELA